MSPTQTAYFVKTFYLFLIITRVFLLLVLLVKPLLSKQFQTQILIRIVIYLLIVDKNKG